MAEDLQDVIDGVLAGELAARTADVAAVDPRLTVHVEQLRDFLAGGKRIRPEFMWSGWRAGGGRAEPADCLPVIRVAVALEFIQACALLHDDLIDRSETRRGRPSAHMAAAKAHADAGLVGESGHHGLATALLLGDVALAWADDLFVAGAHQLAAIGRAQPVWRAMRTEVLAGQLLDLRVTADPGADPAAQSADAATVNRYKTAAYTVERPLQLGAVLAGADRGTVAALRSYGTAIGTAFQLRDDLLGVFGDPAITGKPAGGDLVEGKRTLLLALARGRLAPDAVAELDAGLARDDPAVVARLTALIADSGAPALVEARIQELTTSGIELLAPIEPAARDRLTELARTATDRRR